MNKGLKGNETISQESKTKTTHLTTKIYKSKLNEILFVLSMNARHKHRSLINSIC